MAEIKFESDKTTHQVSDGAEIAFVADEVGASLEFYCYEGACETCRVLVLDGMENLTEVNDKERQTLGEEKIAKGYRLGCQISIRSGGVVLRNGWEE